MKRIPLFVVLAVGVLAADMAMALRFQMLAMPVASTMCSLAPSNRAACTIGSRPIASGSQTAPYPNESSSAINSWARATGCTSR